MPISAKNTQKSWDFAPNPNRPIGALFVYPVTLSHFPGNAISMRVDWASMSKVRDFSYFQTVLLRDFLVLEGKPHLWYYIVIINAV